MGYKLSAISFQLKANGKLMQAARYSGSKNVLRSGDFAPVTVNRSRGLRPALSRARH